MGNNIGATLSMFAAGEIDLINFDNNAGKSVEERLEDANNYLACDGGADFKKEDGKANSSNNYSPWGQVSTCSLTTFNPTEQTKCLSLKVKDLVSEPNKLIDLKNNLYDSVDDIFEKLDLDIWKRGDWESIPACVRKIGQPCSSSGVPFAGFSDPIDLKVISKVIHIKRRFFCKNIKDAFANNKVLKDPTYISYLKEDNPLQKRLKDNISKYKYNFTLKKLCKIGASNADTCGDKKEQKDFSYNNEDSSSSSSSGSSSSSDSDSSSSGSADSDFSSSGSADSDFSSSSSSGSNTSSTDLASGQADCLTAGLNLPDAGAGAAQLAEGTGFSLTTGTNTAEAKKYDPELKGFQSIFNNLCIDPYRLESGELADPNNKSASIRNEIVESVLFARLLQKGGDSGEETLFHNREYKEGKWLAEIKKDEKSDTIRARACVVGSMQKIRAKLKEASYASSGAISVFKEAHLDWDFTEDGYLDFMDYSKILELISNKIKAKRTDKTLNSVDFNAYSSDSNNICWTYEGTAGRCPTTGSKYIKFEFSDTKDHKTGLKHFLLQKWDKKILRGLRTCVLHTAQSNGDERDYYDKEKRA